MHITGILAGPLPYICNAMIVFTAILIALLILNTALTQHHDWLLNMIGICLTGGTLEILSLLHAKFIPADVQDLIEQFERQDEAFKNKLYPKP